MLITTRYGKKILIDGGEENDILLPYLLNRGVKKIDYLMISHFDSDHYAGISSILGKIKVQNIIISKQCEKNYGFEEFIKLASNYRINIIAVKAGENISVDEDTSINILWPTETSLNAMNLNDNSIVAKIDYGETSILCTGDISENVEKVLIDTYSAQILEAEILKIAHHGSNTSSSLEFLEKVKPKIALIGVGKNNKFGHPKTEVLENLEKVGSKIYRTDEDGEINIIIDKNGRIKIKRFLE